MPIEPVKMNADCQPNFSASGGTQRIVMIAPTLAPELKMPVAVPRWRRGNHSATVLMQAGELTASPNPSKTAAGEPLGHRLDAGGEINRLTESQQDAGNPEGEGRRRHRMRHGRQAPYADANGKADAGAELVQ